MSPTLPLCKAKSEGTSGGRTRVRQRFEMNQLCGSSDGQERDVFLVDRLRPEVVRVEMRNKIRV